MFAQNRGLTNKEDKALYSVPGIIRTSEPIQTEMKIRIHKRVAEDQAILVDWRHLEPFWLRSTFAPVDRNKLVDAYYEKWIDKTCSPWSFTLGEISFEKNKQGKRVISFTNGRNRTNLIIKYQILVPICIIGEISSDADIQAALVKPLEEGDFVDIPDLPIKTIDELRKMSS